MGIWLVMKTADGKERPFPIRKPRTIIGRETRCDVRIAVSSVANRHCEITLQDETLTLSDLDSAGAILHNGERVTSARLSHEDTVTIGPVTFVVRIVDGEETHIVRRDLPRPAPEV